MPRENTKSMSVLPFGIPHIQTDGSIRKEKVCVGYGPIKPLRSMMVDWSETMTFTSSAILSTYRYFM